MHQARLFAAPSRHPFIEQLLPGRSIFDLAQTCFADARVALSQHFRCVPRCIALSNELFYHGRLQPRRLPPQSERLLPAIVDVKVARGKKKGKANVREAAARVEYLAAELAEGSGALARRGATVGIISLMGKEQVRVLRALLLQHVSDAQLARHRIVVGDPSSFQGDERDVILLSMVASPGAAPTQVGRMYEQRFNVALSRARDRMVLFRSVDTKDISNRSDLKVATIRFFSQDGGGGGGGGLDRVRGAGAAALSSSGSGGGAFADSTVEGQLFAWLERSGLHFDESCSIAGSLVVIEDCTEDRRLCVCLDGGSGSTLAEWRGAMREQRQMERAGWSFLRLWHAHWLVDRMACESALAAACVSAGIRAPGSRGSAKRSIARAHDSSSSSSSSGGGGGAAPKRVRRGPAARTSAALLHVSESESESASASESESASESASRARARRGKPKTKTKTTKAKKAAARTKAAASGKKTRKKNVPLEKKAKTTAKATKQKVATSKKKASKRKRASADDEWVPEDD